MTKAQPSSIFLFKIDCSYAQALYYKGRLGVEEISVSLVAIFDGHNGEEASDMASKLLLEYFVLHMYFILDLIYSSVMKSSSERLTYSGVQNLIFQELNLDEGKRSQYMDIGRSRWMFPIVFERSFHMLMLKESLLRAIHDIEETFSEEALSKDFESGSTAIIILIADGHILTANIGDSKAIMCSEDPHHSSEVNSSKLRARIRRRATYSAKKNGKFRPTKFGIPSYLVKELTKDHHPSRDDERNRVEAAGGYVVEWAGVFRVNGELAVTRAIGDMAFKSYGVISSPEVTDWHAITSNDSYLVVASDGIFEKLTTQEVCDLLWDREMEVNVNLEFVPVLGQSLADFIVKSAFERGTTDNMATIVVPLRSFAVPGVVLKAGCGPEGCFERSSRGSEKFIHGNSGNDAPCTSLMPMEYIDQIMLKFKRLLVAAKYKRVGCFYLSENLNETMDFAFQGPKGYQKDEVQDLSTALPASDRATYIGGGSPDLYDDHKFCSFIDIHHEPNKGQCASPEVFAKLLGLLDSIPYNETISESVQHEVPNLRYILKRRFDRGSYGEVWLAFHWNCSYDVDMPTKIKKNQFHSFSNFRLDQHNFNSSGEPSFEDPSDGNFFILKRIMVERGTAAYLSGLREKYFGEVFLNASLSLGSSMAARSLTTLPIELRYAGDFILDPATTFPTNYRTFSGSYEEGLNHIARYVESFESDSKEIWLVFRYEGISLSKLMYTAKATKLTAADEMNRQARNIQVLHPSAWWHWLKTTEAGAKELQDIIWQLLMALKSCHDRNITHRDIKPENMIICFEDMETGKCLQEAPMGGKQYRLKMRIIDFGSAIDDVTLKYMYGSGPTRSEQTYEYTPPEALLNASWFREPKSVTLKYDMWSVGVVILELILGSPHVFQISDRTRALLDKHLEGWSEHTIELAYKLRSYMEMCILIPGISSQHHQNVRRDDPRKVWPASWKCSEESFSHQVKSRDPLGLGFPNAWALRLVRQLLVWHPEDRLNVDDALRHPYFQNHPGRRAHGGE
ncbi:uncharacterized protein LOC120250083 isoform X4 [Dioscorea cayenensis subsp. rotundata]|uniref:protein-serine/threonine phosphatase n=1 Tax=Dioscorea cayennensis subsp. rotundata TaxID=55577 RepID=A0AB40AJ68_DIOCR|nr:uncharacterized protein LOC120250083 isoform X4 [Dioscorea cayenensis subsp. rotundata]